MCEGGGHGGGDIERKRLEVLEGEVLNGRIGRKMVIDNHTLSLFF